MYGPVPQINTGPRLADGGWKEHGQKWASDKKTRAINHGQSVYGFLTKSTGEDLMIEWIYFIFKCLASVATVFLLVVLSIASSATVFTDNSDSAVYLTNTFYTSNDIEQNVSWQVLTSQSWNGLARPASGASYAPLPFEHFYECMWVTQLGYGLCNSSAVTASVSTYKVCLDSNYGSQLTTCANTPGGGALSWPTSNQYSQCINNALGNNALSTLNGFRTCIRENPWPLYEIPQDIATPFFLGSYSWPLFVLTSLFLLFVFGLYTFYPIDWEDVTIVEHGKPASRFVRLGMLWSGLALLVAIFWLIIVLLITFRGTPVSTSWPNNYTNFYPSTHQTNVIMVITTFSVVFYFLFEASEYGDRLEKPKGYQNLPDDNGDGPIGPRRPDGTFRQLSSQLQIPGLASMGGNTAPPNPMGYYFPSNAEDKYEVNTVEKAARNEAPVLLKTWTDGYLLDPLFFVGLVGATMQVFTADVYNIFFCLLFYRIAHVGLARVVHFAYVSYGMVNVEAMAATKAFGLALHLAGICALVVPFYIIFDTTRMLNEYSLLVNSFVLCIIIPETLRLLGHLYLAIASPTKSALYVLTVAQFIWCWDLVVRCFILWYLLLPYGFAGARGTKSYLLSGMQSISLILVI